MSAGIAPTAAVHPDAGSRGPRSQRWLARLSLALAGLAVAVLAVFAGLKSVAMLAAGLGAAAVSLIMNPRSGGGKVAKFDLKRKAQDLGADMLLISGHEPVDVAKVAADAVAHGADQLGVAGDDGTQALVAGVAAEHGIPSVVITAGTRNHFALDLGLDRDDPSACLDALRDGVPVRAAKDSGAVR